MKIRVIIYPSAGEDAKKKAEKIFKSTYAQQYGGTLTDLGDNHFEFDIPQAFTEQHPACRYVKENA